MAEPSIMTMDPSGMFPQQAPMGFDYNKIAPSLIGVEPPMDEYGDPDDSWLFDEEYEDKDKENFGLSRLQRHELIQRIERRACEARSHWSDIYRRMEEDWDFFAAEDNGMWDERAKLARTNRPVLQFPLISKFIDHNISSTLRNPPGVKLSPRDDGDVVKSRIGMDLVRYIEDRSGAKYAYSNAIKCISVGGIGWIRVSYKKSTREIQVRQVRDPLRYMIDPDSEELNGSDAMYVVSETRKTRNDKTVSCYEYWWKEKSEDPSREYDVYWALVEGYDILDYGHFPGEVIPIIPVFGEVIRYRDKHVVKGMVRDLKDAQRGYNYLKSQEIETIALTPKSPIIYQEGAIKKKDMHLWENTAMNPGKPLPYQPEDAQGREIKLPPQLMSMKADTQWLQAAAQGSMQDIKEITGIYDTSLGSDNKELSGKAIIAKQISTDSLQLKFTEHLEASIQQVGRCIVGLIMPVMGTERVVRVLGENGKFRTVDLDKPYGIHAGDGQPSIDLDFSEMDLSISSGTAYATRRENGVDMFQSIMQAMPQTASVLADLAIKNMDFDYASEAAERLRKMLPPALQDNGDAPEGYVPAIQLKQAMEMFEQAKQANIRIQAQQQSYIKALEAEMQNQFQSRIAAEQVKGRYKLADTQMKEFGQDRRKALEIESKVGTETAKLQTDLIKSVASAAGSVPQVAVVDSSAAERNAMEQAGLEQLESPNPGLDVTFKDPTLSQSNMSQEDLLMNL